MYTSRTNISCNLPQWGQCTVSVARQTARRLCTSVSMPVGARLKVLGQVKDRAAIGASLVRSQAGARLVSRPRTPGAGPLSGMLVNVTRKTMFRCPVGFPYRTFREEPLARKMGRLLWRAAAPFYFRIALYWGYSAVPLASV